LTAARRIAGALASELRRVQELTKARRYTDALAAARALMRRAPSQRGAFYWAALNQRLLEQTKDALETLDALERAHPDYSLIFQERGHCHVALGDPACAIVSFERAVELNPALASSWAMLERLLSAAGQPQRAGVASQHLSKLKELPPAIVEAGSWFCNGEHVAAENLLTSYIAREGRHVEALRLLGRIAQRRGAAYMVACLDALDPNAAVAESAGAVVVPESNVEGSVVHETLPIQWPVGRSAQKCVIEPMPPWANFMNPVASSRQQVQQENLPRGIIRREFGLGRRPPHADRVGSTRNPRATVET
jgi:tetratricopeptide (TPR) repeat protein